VCRSAAQWLLADFPQLSCIKGKQLNVTIEKLPLQYSVLIALQCIACHCIAQMYKIEQAGLAAQPMTIIQTWAGHVGRCAAKLLDPKGEIQNTLIPLSMVSGIPIILCNHTPFQDQDHGHSYSESSETGQKHRPHETSCNSPRSKAVTSQVYPFEKLRSMNAGNIHRDCL
jgi:hypothetical protein